MGCAVEISVTWNYVDRFFTWVGRIDEVVKFALFRLFTIPNCLMGLYRFIDAIEII